MPLIKGKSPVSFSKNVKTEYESGKPLKQSLAIAYAMKKKAQKMDRGGFVREEEASVYPDMPCEMCKGGSCPKHMMAAGGFVSKEKETGYLAMPNDREKMNKKAEEEEEEEEDRDLNQHGDKEQGPYSKMMADGGFIGSYQDDDHEMDMVDRIMKQRQEHYFKGGMKKYSKGGKVANEDHGPMDDRLAGFKQNEFDDLPLRDDLDSSYSGANSGDEIGDMQEDEDRDDIIDRIMKERMLKNKMPIPGYGTTYGRNK